MKLQEFQAMSLEEQLTQMYDSLTLIKNPYDVFGDLSSRKQLGIVYKNIVRYTHPDIAVASDEIEKLMNDSTVLLNMLKTTAENQLQAKCYGKFNNNPGIYLGTYNTLHVLYEDEIAISYLATDENTNPVVVRVAHNKDANEFMENEAFIIKQINQRPNFDKVAPFFPLLVKSGMHDDLCVTVLSYPAEFVSPEELVPLSKVMAATDNHIGDKHMAWIWRKILFAMDYMHYHGMVHAGLTPNSILITANNSDKHGVVLSNFGYTSNAQSPVTAMSESWESVYPDSLVNPYPGLLPENELPTPQLDIYMAARTMFLINQDMHPALSRYFNWLTAANPLARPKKISLLMDTFDNIIFGELGWKREFVKLPYIDNSMSFDWSIFR